MSTLTLDRAYSYETFAGGNVYIRRTQCQSLSIRMFKSSTCCGIKFISIEGDPRLVSKAELLENLERMEYLVGHTGLITTIDRLGEPVSTHLWHEGRHDKFMEIVVEEILANAERYK